jgi:hypothetical protein
MRTLLLYLTRMRQRYGALKLEWEHDKEINRTRNRWKYATRHPAAPAEKPPK